MKMHREMRKKRLASLLLVGILIAAGIFAPFGIFFENLYLRFTMIGLLVIALSLSCLKAMGENRK